MAAVIAAVLPVPVLLPENKLVGVKLHVKFDADGSTPKAAVVLVQIKFGQVITGVAKNLLTRTLSK